MRPDVEFMFAVLGIVIAVYVHDLIRILVQFEIGLPPAVLNITRQTNEYLKQISRHEMLENFSIK